MKEIVYVQIEEEAKNIIQYNLSNGRKNCKKLTHKGNQYGFTLKYLFAIKDLSFINVGEILGVTAQAVNYLVNRQKEETFENIVFVKKLCNKLNIDYQYFMDLCGKVKELM